MIEQKSASRDLCATNETRCAGWGWGGGRADDANGGRGPEEICQPGLARPELGIVFMTMLNGIYDKEAKPNTRGMIPSYNTDKFDDILLRLRLSLFIFMSTFYPSYSSQIRNQNVFCFIMY